MMIFSGIKMMILYSMNDVLLMKPQASISLARTVAPLKCMQVTNALSFLAKEKFFDNGICW